MLSSIFRTTAALGMVCLVLNSCNSEPKAVDTGLKDKTDTLAEAAVSNASEENEPDFTLPSSLQVATIFKKSGLKYMSGLTNTAENVIKYNSNNYKRAVNLGVYSSDLAYTMLNRQYQESKNYLKVCKEIGAQLGLSRAFEANNLAKRFDQNIDKEDSLIRIVSDIQMQTDILLEENKQKHITAIAFAGAWIESLYIASRVYGNDKNKHVTTSLMEQLTIADKISKALKSCEQREPECMSLNADIHSVQVLFEGCEAVKAAETKGGDIDYEKMTISEQEFKTIADKVSEIRQKLIN